MHRKKKKLRYRCQSLQLQKKKGQFEGINITSLLFMIQSFNVSHKTLGISHIIIKINCINWQKFLCSNGDM